MTETRLIPDSKVRERYGISDAVPLGPDDNLNFPKPVRIRGRKYRDEAQLNEFDASMAKRGA